MNRTEFERLRDLPDKEINQDVIFQYKNPTTMRFTEVQIINSLGIDLVVNGSFLPDIPAVKYNICIRGMGPICRVEVNSTKHRDVGRTHKHSLQKESCSRKNLPHADARPDLEDKSAREVWEILCQQAKINHTGSFIDPE